VPLFASILVLNHVCHCFFCFFWHSSLLCASLSFLALFSLTCFPNNQCFHSPVASFTHRIPFIHSLYIYHDDFPLPRGFSSTLKNSGKSFPLHPHHHTTSKDAKVKGQSIPSSSSTCAFICNPPHSKSILHQKTVFKPSTLCQEETYKEIKTRCGEYTHKKQSRSLRNGEETRSAGYDPVLMRKPKMESTIDQ